MDDLPADYDVIVVGTGMIESMVAAAVSRIGKSVLHLDENDYYGDGWASFSLDGFENWIKSVNDKKADSYSNESFDYLINENEKIVELKSNSNILNASLNHFVIKSEEVDKCDDPKDRSVDEGEEAVCTLIKSEGSLEPQDSLHKQSRRFNLDLCPKLLFSKGMLVDLLITSNVARYAEFKNVNHVLTWRDGQLEPVPCSRADVFATKNVTVVHKRILVKILTLLANYEENLDEFMGFESKTFLKYLKHKKLPENLTHYILYAIAMGDNTTPCLDGVKNCKRFLESLGKYGNTPFIFPLYGSGELPQCFSRLCAVFGGVYCLQRGIQGLIVKDNECVGVISNKKRLNAKTVILSHKYAPKVVLNDENIEGISRAVFVTDRSILNGDRDSITLLQFPPVSKVSDKSVTVVELGSGSSTCPENYYVVHMTAKATKDASTDFSHVVEFLFEREKEKKDSRPKVLWSGTWNFVGGTSATNDWGLKNVKICCNVDSELDYDISISKAKSIFKDLYPEEEFLPRAPDPDEIVLDVDDTSGDVDSAETKSNEQCDASEQTTQVFKEEQNKCPEVAVEAEEKSDNDKPAAENDLASNS